MHRDDSASRGLAPAEQSVHTAHSEETIDNS